MKDSPFSVKDLINNSSFRRVAKGIAGNDEIRFWDRWIEDNEVNREKARQAKKEIVGKLFQHSEVPDIEGEWENLKKITVEKPKDITTPQVRPNHQFNDRWKYYAAAIIILGAFIGISTYFYSPLESSSAHIEQIKREKVIYAEAGEQKTISFSNGSRIILNSNTTVKYSTEYSDEGSINVIVDGEAYFDTGNDGDNSKGSIFEVNTPDGIIKDIGTKFLVSVESDRSVVVLQEGKVLIKSELKPIDDDDVLLTAGHLVELKNSKVISKRSVNTTFHTSWATGSLSFDQTSIRDFARFIEKRFDVIVEISDPMLKEVKIDGGIYFKSVEELVRAVSEVTKIPVYQSGDRKTIYIGTPKSKIGN